MIYEMTNIELVEKLKYIATECKSAYFAGCWGQPSGNVIINAKLQQYPRNTRHVKAAQAIDHEGFLWDCVGLIKSIFWGWRGDMSDFNGGAAYKNGQMPDVDERGLLDRCAYVSTDFSKIEIGEYLWMDGHCGVYIGDGLAVECTPSFDGGVQITAVANIGIKDGFNHRTWTRHGELPYVEYIPETGKVTVELSELSQGAKGAQVKAMQLLLIGNGYSCGATGADGDFGVNTAIALTKWQKDHIKVCEWADGICGEKTWASLLGAK